MTGRFNLEPFASPGYRRYFLAALLAALGLWVYGPALEWTILTQTGLAGAVGVLQSVLIVAVAIATLPSGVLTHRFGARATLTLSLGGMSVLISLLVVAAALNAITFEVALALNFALGLFDGLFGVPAALLLAQVVEPRLLGAAIGLSFLTSGLGRLVGGPIGGIVLQVAGPLQAFVPAAIALAVAAFVIATTPLHHTDDHHDRAPPMRGLIDATRWMLRSRPALSVALLGAISGGSLFSYSALLPAFTRDLLQAEAATLGLLTGAGGLGAIAGALVMDASGRRLGRGRQTVVMLIGAALGLVALGLTTVLPVAVVLAAVIVLLAVLFGGTAQLIVQTAPPPRIRAGVVAVYTFAYYVVVPIGTTTVGVLADSYGVQAVLFGMAAVTIAGTAVVLAWFPGLLRVDVDEHGDLVDPSAARARPQAGAIVGS